MVWDLRPFRKFRKFRESGASSVEYLVLAGALAFFLGGALPLFRASVEQAMGQAAADLTEISYYTDGGGTDKTKEDPVECWYIDRGITCRRRHGLDKPDILPGNTDGLPVIGMPGGGKGAVRKR
jgi:Flp pilus assembly pilin Flp